MESPSISTLACLSPSQQATLKRANVHTVADLVLTSPFDIAKRGKITTYAAQAIVDHACQELASEPTRLDSETSPTTEMFTTGDEALDSMLDGGIRTGMVWEFVGESAAGKTQLSLQLSLFAQLPRELKGLLGSTCFLSTSWTLPTTRILEMIGSHPSLSAALCGLADIHTLKTPTVPVLLRVLSHTLPTFVENRLQAGPRHKPVKLIVIDALTELFHTDPKTSTTSLTQRAKNIAEISVLLHTLADRYGIAVVVLNEVADVFDREAGSDVGLQQDVLYRDQAKWFSRAHTFPGEDRKEAALGLTWANQVNARVMLSRTDRMIYFNDDDDARASKRRRLDRDARTDTQRPVSNQQTTRLRHMTVIFSSVGPPGSLDYIVSDRGIVAIPQEHSTLVPAPPETDRTPTAVLQHPQVLDAPGADVPAGGTQAIPSSQPNEQLLDMGAIALGSDAFSFPGSDEVEAEDGPQAEADDWEAYWKDADLDDDLYGSIDLDVLSSSNPG